MLTIDKSKIGRVIGRGKFSIVREYGPTQVIIFSSDPVKEALSLGWCGASSLLPKLERAWLDDKSVYISKRYQKITAPKKQLNARSYVRYQELRKLQASLPLGADYVTLINSFSAIPDTPLRKALREATDGLASFGSNFSFEISPRNIAATAKGNLILLDTFFFRTK